MNIQTDRKRSSSWFLSEDGESLSRGALIGSRVLIFLLLLVGLAVLPVRLGGEIPLAALFFIPATALTILQLPSGAQPASQKN